MTLEDRINKLLDQADAAKNAGNFALAVEKYRRVAEFYFAAGEKTEDIELAQKYFKYGKAFVRAADIIAKNE